VSLAPPPVEEGLVTRTLTADRGDAGRRLDLVLRRHVTDVRVATRTRVQAWIEGGRVTVNGRPVRRAAARTAAGDIVAVSLPEAPQRVMAAEAVALDILYEDEHLLALNKPPGIVVHPTYKHADGTLMNALLWHARAWPAACRPSLVGRLDKDTSGIVLVAKSAAAHAALQRTLGLAGSAGDHPAGCEKVYLAVVHGRVNVARGRIVLRLARDAADRRRVVASETTGAASLTHFERLARTPAAGAALSVLRCRLTTGRTHQIRVHLAARGWPIVGDVAYGKPRRAQIADDALEAALRACRRQALHAWRLAFTHPLTRRHLVIDAPIPADIERLLAAGGLEAGWR
ncbi:MAG TPA: RluA family pseudouridine synthase, partial [Vicinamibacterales bacterium]|nr:RluA family pseudouridine synthase [Vicinamibacterales bacterium]